MTKKSYQIEVVNSDLAYQCQDEQNLLNGMVKLGKKGIPVGCCGGGCGICKVKVIEGEYNCKKMSRAHITETEQEEGYVLACRCNPDSNLVLEVVGKMKRCISRAGFSTENTVS